MPDSDANQAMVEGARVILMEAARNLTSDIEPAVIFSVEPHSLPENEEQE